MASATTTPTSRSTGRERIPVADLSALSESLGRMMLDSAERFQGTALEFRRGAETVAISYPQLGAIAAEIARGLIALGIERGDRVAILGATSAQWTLADYGSLCAGAIVTPIYHTNSPEECAYVLKHSETRLVFCENPANAPPWTTSFCSRGCARARSRSSSFASLLPRQPNGRCSYGCPPCTPMTSRRWCTRRGRPGRRRGAC
jgi:non-ribosomal peptide synthetase component F